MPTGVAWFSLSPEGEVPGSAVCPLPDELLLEVGGSYPHPSLACSVHSLPDKVIGGIRVDRGQVATLPLTEDLSGKPILPFGAEVVAVVSVLLPATFAGFDAHVSAAS